MEPKRHDGDNDECKFYTNNKCIIHLYNHIISICFCSNENVTFLEAPPNKINHYQCWILFMKNDLALICLNILIY